MSLKKYIRDYLILLLVAGCIIALDQWTKSLVRQNLAVGESWVPWAWMAPYARIVHWYNTGVALGLFQGKGDVFGILAVIVAIVILYYFPRVPAQDWTLRVAMCFQLGGAVGNLIDRVLFDGIVTDFIMVGNFPVFNIADSSITIGTAVLLIGVFIQERREKQKKAAMPEEPPTPEGHDAM
jgi:signal peptidase II